VKTVPAIHCEGSLYFFLPRLIYKSASSDQVYPAGERCFGKLKREREKIKLRFIRNALVLVELSFHSDGNKGLWEEE